MSKTNQLMDSYSIESKENTVLGISVTQSAQELPLHEWDQLAKRCNPFAKVKWLTYLEKSMSNYLPYYIQVHQNGALVYGLVFHQQENYQLSSHVKSKLSASILSIGLKVFTPNSFTLPMFATHGFISNSDNIAFENIWPDLLPVINKIQKKCGSYMFSVYPLTDKEAQHMSTFGMVQTPILDDAILNIEWPSFEEYQSALPRKYRAEIRRVRNRAKDHGVEIEQLPLASTKASVIERLMKNVIEKHNSTYLLVDDVVKITNDYLDNTDYRHLVARLDGQVIGTLTLFHSEGLVLVRWAGLDYERTANNFTYHYLMSETVKIAIEMGAHTLKLGGTVLVLKKKLGARIVQRSAVMELRFAFMNKCSQTLLRLMK